MKMIAGADIHPGDICYSVKEGDTLVWYPIRAETTTAAPEAPAAPPTDKPKPEDWVKKQNADKGWKEGQHHPAGCGCDLDCRFDKNTADN